MKQVSIPVRFIPPYQPTPPSGSFETEIHLTKLRLGKKVAIANGELPSPFVRLAYITGVSCSVTLQGKTIWIYEFMYDGAPIFYDSQFTLIIYGRYNRIRL